MNTHEQVKLFLQELSYLIEDEEDNSLSRFWVSKLDAETTIKMLAFINNSQLLWDDDKKQLYFFIDWSLV